MGWKSLSTGVSSSGPTIVFGAAPQTDGSLVYPYGVDSFGRPTYTAAGTTDTTAIVILQDDGRYAVREIV